MKLPGEGYLLRPWASVTQTSGNPGQRQGLPLNPESSAPGSARARGQRRNCQERSSCRINRRRRHPPYEDSPGCHLRVRQCKYPPRDQHSPHKCPAREEKGRNSVRSVCKTDGLQKTLQLSSGQQAQRGRKPPQGRARSDPRTCAQSSRFHCGRGWWFGSDKATGGFLLAPLPRPEPMLCNSPAEVLAELAWKAGFVDATAKSVRSVAEAAGWKEGHEAD